MKKLFVIALALIATTAAFAQKNDSTAAVKKLLIAAPPPAAKPNPNKKDWSKLNLTRRANDHFMFELGYDAWAGKPDSIHTGGLPRSVNVYFMFDFPFKTDPRLSIGAGLGIGSSNIFFDKQEVLVAAVNNPTLAFPDESGANHYKKYKLVTTFLEAPVELRFALDPENTNKSWKFAVGVKVGLLLSAYTKGKTLENNVGQTLANYTIKESSKQFFNGTRLAGTARINKGVFGVFGQISATGLIKSSAGPSIFPFSAGIVLSGL
ncbi:MAG TPA: outer membrane beta-barrel protein [Puia sp.]|nr:outer membrane beta-barrel protein [Puia sp.]